MQIKNDEIAKLKPMLLAVEKGERTGPLAEVFRKADRLRPFAIFLKNKTVCIVSGSFNFFMKGCLISMKLLLIVNETKLIKALFVLLKKSGYITDVATEGNSGFEMALTENYDLIILDQILPLRDGISIVKEFRSLGYDTPVLMISVNGAPQDRVAGLDSGADDYLVKPFPEGEFLARVRALTRRKDKGLTEQVITAGGLTLNPLKREVIKGDEVIKLSSKESLLLELLMRNCGHVITKECIFERVWGFSSQTDLANINLYIHYLRKKLSNSYIKTIRGVGYLLKGD